MQQLNLFGEEYAAPPPKPKGRPKKTAPSPNPSQGGEQGEHDDDYYALSESPLLGRGKGEAVSRSLRDLGISGQEAAFYTSMRQATKMAPHSIRCVLEALIEYVATCIAEGRDARIPGLCTVGSKPVAERTTQLDNGHGIITRCTIPAHRKIIIKPAPSLVRSANALREGDSLEFK